MPLLFATHVQQGFREDSGGSRGGARGAPAPAGIWLAPEVPRPVTHRVFTLALSRLKFNLGRVIGINRRYKTPLIQGRAFIGGARA